MGGKRLSPFKEEEELPIPTSYASTPAAPPGLWDTDDARLLEMVKCHAVVRVTGINPQLSTFDVRMKCHWTFRTLNSQEGAELRWRGIPGIRMPGLLVDVEESRIWKDLTKKPRGELWTTASSVYWRGTSTFAIHGFKLFQMRDFPFDRQVVNFERIEFVWRPSNWPEKDSQDDYYKSMQVVSFTVETTSMLPEWGTYPAWVIARNEIEASEPPAPPPHDKLVPTFANRFTLQLRIERKHWFYVRQVFFVTYLITLVSCTPLGMPPKYEYMGDRLQLYGGGLLTLVAFKYGVAEHLPSVPYATFTDDFLLHQILTITMCCFETLAAYRLPAMDEEDGRFWMLWDNMENLIFLALFVGWTAYTFYAAFIKPKFRRSWRYVRDEQVGAQCPQGHRMKSEKSVSAACCGCGESSPQYRCSEGCSYYLCLSCNSKGVGHEFELENHDAE